MPEGAKSAAADSADNLEARGGELAGGDTSLRENQSEMNETDAAEQFETCPSKFSLDGLGQMGAKQSWSQPGLSLTASVDGAEWEVAPKEELFPEELSTSRLNPPSKLNPAQLETFWTALEEQEAAGPPAAQRLARGDSPSAAARGDGEGRAGAQPEPGSPGPAAAQGRCSGYSRIDFKKADFWKPDRAEEKREQDASSPKNPFAAALSPNSPSNPFVEKPPTPLPVQAVLPEKLGQGGFSFTHLREEALGRGFQPTNPPEEQQSPSLHASQPLAFSTPFLVAATNPPQFDLPSPVACPASSAVPAATSRPAARPCPLPQSGDTQASALVVLPRETQPAEKSLFQQTTR